MQSTLSQREDVPVEDRWDVEYVFADEGAFDAAVEHIGDYSAALSKLQGTLGHSAAGLRAALDLRQEAALLMGKVLLYASMMRNGDGTSPQNTAREGRARALYATFAAAEAFFEPEILSIPPAMLQHMVENDPGLAPYRYYLASLARLRPHTRSAEVEEVLAASSDMANIGYQTHIALENTDLRFGTIQDENGFAVELAPGNADAYIESQDRAVRRAAWQTYADGYLSVKNAMAATLTGAVKRDVFYARARRYPDARMASLYPYNIPASVFDGLIATVNAHLPLWHRYWDIRRRALGVETLHPYDLHVPLATLPASVPFARGVEMLLDGLAPLGEEYVAAARRGMTVERWVDKYPNVGKPAGAFSTGVPGTRPFIMQNYDDSILGVSTLAHEMGHSMHSWYAWRAQPSIYARYSMIAAETASNFNQALLRAHLLETTDDPRTQVAIIEEGMANFQRYFFIMPILAQFEQEAHARVERGEGLTAAALSAILLPLYEAGYGGQVSIDSARVGVTWAQFTHLFMNFYVWQYAIGISAANALAAGVREGGAPAAERYISFLKAGGSMDGLDALRLAGVDMTDTAPIERAFTVLTGLVDKLDGIVGDGPLPWLQPQKDTGDNATGAR